MSDGKYYGPITDGSVDPLARITELERLWPIIQQKLSAYDGLVQEVQALKKHIVSLKSDHVDLSTEVDTLGKDLDKHAQLMLSEFGCVNLELDKKTAIHGSSLDNHSTMLARINADLQQTKGIIQVARDADRKQLSDMVTKAELQAHKDASSVAITTANAQIQTLGTRVADASITAEAAKATVGYHKDLIANVSEDLHGLNAVCMNLQTGLVNLRKELPDSISAEVKKFSAETDTKIKDLKSSISPATAINALRDEFSKKLEGVALDGTNAVLRSTNASGQITMLEKRIENILLRIKAIEIPQ